MKTNLYYFSGTGNSLAAAKELSVELTGEVEILPIAKLMGQEKIEPHADSVGILFPVYCHDIPVIVEQFAKKLNITNSYVFGIATYNKVPGNSLFNLDAILKKTGPGLSAGFEICMPGNSVLVLDFTSSDEENAIRFKNQKEKIKVIGGIINEKKPVGIEGAFDKDDKYESKIFLKEQYKVPQQFWTTESCTACGICVKVCPKNNVKLENKKVSWQDDCEHCLACLHWCPEKAVQSGENTINFRRYTHPEISVAEIISQS
ncbi:MAG: hypothetical protein GY754_18940 [bacterium]|nr:hypothetical protein [bacterium]